MATKFNKNGVYEHDGVEHSFNFCASISAVEKMSFVNDVVDLVVNDTYDYVIRDLMFDYMVINTFTDVNCEDINECDNGKLAITMIEDLVCNTMIVDIVKANAVAGLFAELNRAVDYSIEFKTGIRINPVADALTNLLNKVSDKLDSYDVDALGDIGKLMSGLNTGDFNIDNLLAAYANSDVYKQTQENAINRQAELAKKIQLVAEKANRA